MITDDAAIQQLLNAGVDRSQLVYDTNVSVLIEKLSRGEIDLWCYSEAVGRLISQQVTGDYYTFKVVFMLQNIDSYYAFSRDVPDTLVSSFQQALGTVRNQKDAQGVSEYERIIYRYVGIGCARPSFTDAEVINLVNTTAEAIEKNASDAFREDQRTGASLSGPEEPGTLRLCL
ncbi:MAG: hypothetical protein WA130_08825 [Candidatus Methanoperedens sp.]